MILQTDFARAEAVLAWEEEKAIILALYLLASEVVEKEVLYALDYLESQEEVPGMEPTSRLI